MQCIVSRPQLVKSILSENTKQAEMVHEIENVRV